MTELSVDPVLVGALEDSELLFDTMHRAAEDNHPPLRLVHTGLEMILARLDGPADTVAALHIVNLPKS